MTQPTTPEGWQPTDTDYEHAHGAAWKAWKSHELGDSDAHFKALDDALQHFVGSLELRAMLPASPSPPVGGGTGQHLVAEKLGAMSTSEKGAPNRYKEGYVNGYRKGWADAGGKSDD